MKEDGHHIFLAKEIAMCYPLGKPIIFYISERGKVMQTYTPNSNQGNQTDNYQNYNYTGNGSGGYYDNGNPNANYNYDPNYHYGNQGQYQGPYNNQGYMDMNSGFEAGNSAMSGMQNLKTIAAQEVVAKSFLFMVAALIITAVASLTTSPMVAYRMLTGNGFFILLIAELAIVMVSNWAVSKNNAILAGVLFAAYSYLTGVTFSILFIAYTTASITIIFLVTAALFGIMAIFGLVTKKDLSSAGSILMMGLLGIVIVSFVNLFLLKSSMLDTVICAVGVLVFVGLTAYDTQKIKRLAAVSNDGNVLSLALMGAFELYLDFINLFLKLLRLFGKSRD